MTVRAGARGYRQTCLPPLYRKHTPILCTRCHIFLLERLKRNHKKCCVHSPDPARGTPPPAAPTHGDSRGHVTCVKPYG